VEDVLVAAYFNGVKTLSAAAHTAWSSALDEHFHRLFLVCPLCKEAVFSRLRPSHAKSDMAGSTAGEAADDEEEEGHQWPKTPQHPPSY